MRPWLVWTLFAVCLAVVLAAMGWTSATVLRLDAAQSAARAQAGVEENVRLALWRMDSALAPLIARESTWPYFAYTPFYPAQRAYTNMLLPVRQGEVLVPSPLLNQPSAHVLVHFQVGPDSQLSSPQVPTGKVRELALSGYTSQAAIGRAEQQLERLRRAASFDEFAALLAPPDTPPLRMAMLPPENPPGQQALLPTPQPQGKGYDLSQRMERQQQQVALQKSSQPPALKKANPALAQQQEMNASEFSARNDILVSNTAQYAGDLEQALQQRLSDVHEGMTRPLWLDNRLFLARRVAVNGGEYVQGCWLDWPSLRRTLIEEVHDLLPNARLEPMGPAAADQRDRALAALPVRLIPGELRVQTYHNPWPLRISLIVAWGCMLLAAGAVAVLLQGALSLSERRGAFVSAVTHEMRTPLTTFRMYTEMLVKGMVPEQRRVKYVDTLRVEADRLSHLVENVLAYARLERGKLNSRLETTTPADLVERARERLADRAGQAGMRLAVNVPEGSDCPVRADPTVVEQILFNLVDNACKYAASAGDRTIHLRVGRSEEEISLAVCDHGPGVSAEQQRRLFRPFSKSAQQAAHSAPGVGLGLALSRRLARRMGGDLRYDRQNSCGAAFILALPPAAEDADESSRLRR